MRAVSPVPASGGHNSLQLILPKKFTACFKVVKAGSTDRESKMACKDNH
jgi:hypothetical protein